MFQSSQLDNDRGSHTFADAITASHDSLANLNPLEAAVNAVKKYVCLLDEPSVISSVGGCSVANFWWCVDATDFTAKLR